MPRRPVRRRGRISVAEARGRLPGLLGPALNASSGRRRGQQEGNGCRHLLRRTQPAQWDRSQSLGVGLAGYGGVPARRPADDTGHDAVDRYAVRRKLRRQRPGQCHERRLGRRRRTEVPGRRAEHRRQERPGADHPARRGRAQVGQGGRRQVEEGAGVDRNGVVEPGLVQLAERPAVGAAGDVDHLVQPAPSHDGVGHQCAARAGSAEGLDGNRSLRPGGAKLSRDRLRPCAVAAGVDQQRLARRRNQPAQRGANAGAAASDDCDGAGHAGAGRVGAGCVGAGRINGG